MCLERIQTLPLTKDTLLTLLNDGVNPIVRHDDVVETIGTLSRTE